MLRLENPFTVNLSRYISGAGLWHGVGAAAAAPGVAADDPFESKPHPFDAAVLGDGLCSVM